MQLSSEDREGVGLTMVGGQKDLGAGTSSDTYHRTRLVQARWSRLALLALHSFPAGDPSLSLCRRGDGGIGHLLPGSGTSNTSLRDAPGVSLPTSRPPAQPGFSLPASPEPPLPPASFPRFLLPQFPSSCPHLLSTLAPITFLSSGSRKTLTKGLEAKPENDAGGLHLCYRLISVPLPSTRPLPPCMFVTHAGPAPAVVIHC